MAEFTNEELNTEEFGINEDIPPSSTLEAKCTVYVKPTCTVYVQQENVTIKTENIGKH